MKAAKFLASPTGTVLVVGVLGVVVMSVAAYGAKSAADNAVEAISPTNPDNIFASGVNNIGKSLSGKDNWNLGGWIYDITHADT